MLGTMHQRRVYQMEKLEAQAQRVKQAEAKPEAKVAVKAAAKPKAKAKSKR